jgi:hypothetical protein
VTFNPGASTDYFDVPLGSVYLPESGPLVGLRWSPRAMRTSGTGNLRWDFFWFVPANESVSTLTITPTGVGIFNDGNYWCTDPERNMACIAEADYDFRTDAELSGRVPLWLEPGFNAIALSRGFDPQGDFYETPFTTGRVRIVFTPAYLT